jgi:hypothetical protein
MLSIFRVMSVYSLFAVRFFADVPFYSCVAGRIGMQVESGLHVLVSMGGGHRQGWGMGAEGIDGKSNNMREARVMECRKRASQGPL